MHLGRLFVGFYDYNSIVTEYHLLRKINGLILVKIHAVHFALKTAMFHSHFDESDYKLWIISVMK
jgi:hypothetical protein